MPIETSSIHTTLVAGLSVTPLYAALFALLLIPLVLRVARRRRQQLVSLGDGGDKQLTKLMRGHGNFVETVPMALLLLLMMELCGAAAALLHGLGILLLAGRSVHYLQLTGTLRPLQYRVAGMMATIVVYLIASMWLLVVLLF